MLADAGLDGRRATTHWYWADALQTPPQAQVEADRIYIADGPVWTSAGMTAEIDLALALVEKDLGTKVARAVAHRLVMHQRRSGGQSQHSEMLRLAPSPTASSWRWNMRGATWRSRSASRNWPRRPS